MKYHKIPNVEKTVCTAEQKIAYNLARNIPFNLMEGGFQLSKRGASSLFRK